MNNENFITSYKKNLGKNYMIIERREQTCSDTIPFQSRMLHENRIPGLLNTHVQYVDGLPLFQYDITSLQSLEILLDTSPITYHMLCKIISGIYNGLLSLEDYLLVHEHVMLSPEYIYLDADSLDIHLCYYPFKCNSFSESIKAFFDYILKNVDHNDEKCVYMAYSMHKYCHDSNFNLNTLYAKLSAIHPTSSTNHKDSTYQPSSNIDLLPHDIPTTTPYALQSPNIYEETTNKKDVDNSFFKENNDIKQNMMHQLKAHNTGIIFLTAFTILGISISTILYVLEIFPLSFYGVLICTILIISCYNIYHICRQKSNSTITSNFSTPTSIDESSYNLGTVLLSGSYEENTHKLIYTGTGEGFDISLTHFPFVIGKTDSCSAKIQNSVISRLHAKINILPTDNNEDDIFLEDLNSTNGTLLNNVPLTPYEKYPITSGDYITFGHLTYIFR